EIARSAQGLVLYTVPVDGNLIALEDIPAPDPPAVEHRLAPTPADGFEFLQGVGELQEAGRSGKRLGPKIGSDPVGHHRNIIEDGDPQEVVNLLAGEELGFIDQQAGDLRMAPRGVEGLPDRVLGGDLEIRIAFDTQPGDD